jgi:GNAT superfamily N-acetyltransferase
MHVTLAAPATLMPFDAPHLPGAVRLSQELRWPHRLEDWAFALGLSEGMVAVREEAVVGTILLTPFGPGMAAVSMVIVDRALRGRGLGRLLLRTVLERAGERWLRLTATPEGAPLYRQLGFVDLRAKGAETTSPTIAVRASTHDGKITDTAKLRLLGNLPETQGR